MINFALKIDKIDDKLFFENFYIFILLYIVRLKFTSITKILLATNGAPTKLILKTGVRGFLFFN